MLSGDSGVEEERECRDVGVATVLRVVEATGIGSARSTDGEAAERVGNGNEGVETVESSGSRAGESNVVALVARTGETYSGVRFGSCADLTVSV